jgi:hypothetical protein
MDETATCPRSLSFPSGAVPRRIRLTRTITANSRRTGSSCAMRRSGGPVAFGGGPRLTEGDITR